VGSDNPFGADNQQERLWYCGWIAGFVDGEGCCSCPIFRNRKTTLRWQVQPTFVVVQSASSRDVLEDLARFFGCGKEYVNRSTTITGRICTGSTWGGSQTDGT
jgi:hypothetical protein